MTLQSLTPCERLVLDKIGFTPETGCTRSRLVKHTTISYQTIWGCLNRLVERGYVAHTPALRNRTYWRVKERPIPTTTIRQGPTLDDNLAALRLRVDRAEQIEFALHKILNILAEINFHVPMKEI